MTAPNEPSERERMAARLTKLLESETPERVAERKRLSARYGHDKRKLNQGEPLEGELLELAINAVGRRTEIAEKWKAGRPLSEYELHLMVDMYLVHARLSS
jgi:hypothetical protein